MVGRNSCRFPARFQDKECQKLRATPQGPERRGSSFKATQQVQLGPEPSPAVITGHVASLTRRHQLHGCKSWPWTCSGCSCHLGQGLGVPGTWTAPAKCVPADRSWGSRALGPELPRRGLAFLQKPEERALGSPCWPSPGTSGSRSIGPCTHLHL